jgi:hypothetical protein
MLVGIVGRSYEPGLPLSDAVRQSVGRAIDAILQELKRLGFDFQKRLLPNQPGIWWATIPALTCALVQ